MEPLISVIVPVYKVEEYLHRCVDSILMQTYKNLEVILVDDGSPDNCGVICDEYARKDPRVHVIHKKNGGLSDARNAGMAVSTGEYLAFVDSDDWLAEDGIQYLYHILTEHDAQLAIGGRQRVDDRDGHVLDTEFHGTENVKEMNKTEAMRSVLRNGCASWARLYERKIHIDIPFPSGEINEDEAVVLQILGKCNRIVQSNYIVYNYRCRDESITTTSFSAKKLIWQKHCADNLTFVQENYPELKLDAAKRYRDSLLWSLTEVMLSDDDFSNEKEQMCSALRTHYNLFRKCPYSYAQDKIRLFLLRYVPSVYEFFIRKKRGL